jgi:hypothetical protein
MGDVSKYFSWQPVVGEPQVIGDQVIRLQAQAILLNTPFGGFVWNRPTAVLVEKDGVTDEVPIVDATRYALISIGVMGMVGMMLAKLIAGAKR